MAASLESYLADLTDFEIEDATEDTNELPKGILTAQIQSLV